MGKSAEAACPACGGEFSCGASLVGCWCAGLELSEATLEELRGRFDGCLCRACLEAYAARDAVSGPADGDSDSRGTGASRSA